MLFGIVPTTCSDYIEEMRGRIIKALKDDPDAAIRWPTLEELREWALLVHGREPSVHNIVGFIDGVVLACQAPDDPDEQNAMYDWDTGDTAVNNVLAFAPTGKVFYAAINYPGSWHDSHVANGLARKCQSTLGPQGFACCVDKGFKRSSEMKDIFVGPRSDRSIRKIPAGPARNAEIQRCHVYVSLRQAAEWGMRSLQGSFARLKARLPSNKQVRRDIIYSILLLHNFRTVRVGLNQIATVFNPEYVDIINLNGYDRIRKFYFQDIEGGDGDDDL
jgi:hypothetical protein